MTEIQNHKQLTFDLISKLEFGACNLLFLSEPKVRIYEPEAGLSGVS